MKTLGKNAEPVPRLALSHKRRLPYGAAMSEVDRIAVVLLAAGRGERAGGGEPKQYRTLGRLSVLARALGSLAVHERIGPVVLVVAPGEESRARAAIGQTADEVRIVTGGATRRESVTAAVAALSGDEPPRHVLVHDSARPFVPRAALDRLIAALDAGAAGVIPVLAVADTLVRREDGAVVPRDGLLRVQTPQGFRLDLLREAHDRWGAAQEATDDAQMVRALGHEIAMVEGDVRMEKITTADDFARLAALNGIAAEPRTGTGYDVHRLEPGRPLWLCGIEIAHDHGLSGHSDADVAIHALVDALLGAIGDGDIGFHFPPSDARWRGTPSSTFLEFARDRIAQHGGRIAHVDLTIICEAPRIGPHRNAMRERLANLLAVDADRVSVKATTTEGLGFTGRREGIAAQATATVLIEG